MINRVIIKNFKGIKYADISFSQKNVIVGNNGVGKSTILEAISLALGQNNYGFELTPYLFHRSTWNNLNKSFLPSIIIEVYLDNIPGFEEFTGKNNTLRTECLGIKFEAKFDESYIELIEAEELTQIPCEYYTISRSWFSEDVVKPFLQPFSVQVINSASSLHNVKMTQFITRHLQSNLSEEQNRHLKTTLRGLRDNFNANKKVSDVNKELTEIAKDFHDKLEISLDLTTYAAWNAISCPFVDEIPVHLCGQGEQCILKTIVSLSKRNKKEGRFNIFLIEEPESHLSHTYMYDFIRLLESQIDGQIFLTTHNSFIANRMNLSNLVIINNQNGVINSLSLSKEENAELYNYFYTTTDYPTLRLALCKSAILVEGPTDEMIVQYHLEKIKKYVFQDGVELLAVGGVRFKNFISLAAILGKKVAIITDNDGKSKEYIRNLYLDEELKTFHETICVFTCEDTADSTLEIAFINKNKERFGDMAKIIRKKKEKDDSVGKLQDFMLKNKTTWAYRLLESKDRSFETPDYIEEAIRWIYE